MRKSLSIIVTAFILAILSTTAVFAADVTEGAEAAQPAATAQSSSGVVNINNADADQLALLPRVGAKAAERILEYRKEHGPFRKTTDLMQVKGFGDKTFELVKPYITVDGKTTLSEKVRGARKPRASRKAA